MPERVFVIANTTASRYRKDARLLGRVAAACRGKAELFATQAPRELDAIARQIAETEGALVALTGGDGTFMAGVTALSKAHGERPLPPVALIPGGTAATVAKNFGSVGAPDLLLERLLGGRRRRTTERPTLRVVAELGGGAADEERVGFIFGTGLVASFFDVYYEEGARGELGAASIVARVFGQSFVSGPFARRVLEPLPCTVVVDGEPLAPRAFSLICASVVRNLGLHMMVTYRAGEDPDRVHLVASPLGPRALGPRVVRVLSGTRIAPPPHFDDLVRSFEVRFADPDGPYVLDGDALRARAVRVQPGPRLRVVVP